MNKNDIDIKTDDINKETEVQVSQMLMKVFLLGLLVGKGQLQDDANASGSPMAMVLGQLQGQFDQLMPGSKPSAEAQAYAFHKNMMMNAVNNIFKKEQTEKTKEELKKISNENLTPNDKRLNDQHDVIVRQMMDSLEEEMKQTASNIVKDTKIFKK